ncbi:MAG: hypothetical protein J5379_07345 [Clostridiales bacterium]|nr:hypothetical protein [Clostridiales bacterium]
MTQNNDIRLPSWISPGMVFQQGVPVVLRGEVGTAKVPVTLEVMKDPTDGRKVSKLDTDYGVILSLETVSEEDGSFRFELPAYRSSTDAYTLVFHSLTKSLTIEDCRCGDVWVMFGGRPLSQAIAETAAPRTPLKKDVMPLLRFYSPKRGKLEHIEDISYEPVMTEEDSKWIRIRDTRELANVSSVAFSYAYHLAEQLHYPVGILDLAEDYAPIYRWLSHEGIDGNDTIRGYLEDRNLYFDEDGWRANVARLTEKKEAIKTGSIIKEDEDGEGEPKSEESLVFEDEEKCDVPIDPEGALAFEDHQGGKPVTEEKSEDASDGGEEPNDNASEEDTSKEQGTSEQQDSEEKDVKAESIPTDSLEEALPPEPEEDESEDEPPLSFPSEELAHYEKERKNNLDLLNSIIPSAETIQTETLVSEAAHRPLVGPQDMMSVFFNHKLAPLCDSSIRGIVFAPDASDAQIGKPYTAMVRQLLIDLAGVFGPRRIEDKHQVPSFIILQLHPDAMDPEFPYRHVEFNETLCAIRRKFPMPIGILGQHDLLLPNKAVSFTLGRRLSCIALGLHFTPKMPASSPECVGVEVIGNKVMLSFDNTVDGLRLSENESVLRGFAVCDESRVYVPASARILHGVRVMVWNDDVLDPVGVTYGYSPIPHQATFRNRIDLPVLPFRFDRIPSEYCPDLTFTSCEDIDFIGKKTWDSDFEKLQTFQVTKGKANIFREVMNKTQGAASLRIEYEPENSLLSFGPVLSYASVMAPLRFSKARKICLDVFNPDQCEKTMQISGFRGEATIQIGLRWQTITLNWSSFDEMEISDLIFTIFDRQRSGAIYIDNIRFLP